MSKLMNYGIFNFIVFIKVPHVILLLLVARKDADFPEMVGVQKTVEHRGTERAGSAGDE